MLRAWITSRVARRSSERHALPHQTPAFVVKSVRGRREDRVRIPVYLDNVSQTGIGFFAPSSETFKYLDVMTLEVDGLRSPIRLRRVRDTTGSEWTYCGAAFLENRPAVLSAFERLFNDGHQLSGRVLRWEHAHVM
jgi:hypothetical protein